MSSLCKVVYITEDDGGGSSQERGILWEEHQYLIERVR